MRTGPAVLRRRLAAILAAALALAGLARPASAGGGPDLVVGVGRTLAVEGVPGGGGMSLGLSLLWPLEDHFRVGLMGFAEALGEETARLIGPGGADLGPVAGVHRASQGAAVRLEAHLPGDHLLSPYLAATWGYYRVADDIRGAALGRDDAAGFGLGAGLMRRFNPRHAAGLALRAQQLSRSDAGRYLSVCLEWRWSTGAGD
jgi:hypothetical protein